MVLDPNATIWAIDGQPDGLDLERCGRMGVFLPIVFHAAITSYDSLFATFLALNTTRYHGTLPNAMT
jgi:hypothetical protein